MNYAYGPNLQTGEGSYGNAVLSKYPISEVINKPLPVIDSTEKRGLLQAIVSLPGGPELKIMVTHLSTDFKEREQQLKWINEYTNNIETPFILMGDFNQRIPAINLEGLYPLATNVKTYPSTAPEELIDLVFSNYNFRVEEYTIDTMASDHLPVIVKLPAFPLHNIPLTGTG